MKLKDIMPFSVIFTIEVALVSSIGKRWSWRKEEYWRNDIKKSIAALKFIRNN